MTDALDALRAEPTRSVPDREFGRDLLGRTRDHLDRSPVGTDPVSHAASPLVDDEVMDEALELLAGTAAEFDPFGQQLLHRQPRTHDRRCALRASAAPTR